MKTINGYTLLSEFTADNAGFCRWAFAEKNGHTYFIKQFISPKYPLETQELTEKSRKKRLELCKKFVEQKMGIYSTLKHIRTGNLVVIEDFFREDSFYYITTDKISKESTLSLDRVFTLSLEKKLLLLRALTYSIMNLHSKGIVHADIKPDNILVKKTSSDFYTAKIIDFDISYFEGHEPEEILGDQIYFAPESRLRMMGEDVKLTTKVDIYALGVLFHLYWVGELPKFESKYEFAFEAVLEGAHVDLSPSLPDELKKLINSMIERDPAKRPTAADIMTSLSNFGEVGKHKAKSFHVPKIDS